MNILFKQLFKKGLSCKSLYIRVSYALTEKQLMTVSDYDLRGT